MKNWMKKWHAKDEDSSTLLKVKDLQGLEISQINCITAKQFSDYLCSRSASDSRPHVISTIMVSA